MHERQLVVSGSGRHEPVVAISSPRKKLIGGRPTVSDTIPSHGGRSLARRQLLLRLQLQSNPKVLCGVRGAIFPLAAAIGFNEGDCRAITLALDEAITNVIRHAYGGKLGRGIEIAFSKLDGTKKERPGLEILLFDHGAKPKPDSFKGLPPGELRSGGLGLHFMRQSMDMVVHTRVGSTNRLRMVKFIR
jgi:serine/threonine-protein kinase RsbW